MSGLSFRVVVEASHNLATNQWFQESSKTTLYHQLKLLIEIMFSVEIIYFSLINNRWLLQNEKGPRLTKYDVSNLDSFTDM